MTINEALEILKKLQEKHGNINIYFDCPKCGIAFSPSIAVTQAEHFTAEIVKK